MRKRFMSVGDHEPPSGGAVGRATNARVGSSWVSMIHGMPKKPKTTRTTFALSTERGASISRQELEVEKTKYEKQIASEFATAISCRLKRRFELQSDPLPEADDRDAVLRDEHGVRQRIQLVELRDVDRQRRMASDEQATKSDLDAESLEQRMLDTIRRKTERYPSTKGDDLWLVVHSSDYPTTLLMFASRSARAFLANNRCPFSIIWVFHSTIQPDAGCIEQLWPAGFESDSVRAILGSDVPSDAYRIQLFRGEEMKSLGTVRSKAAARCRQGG